MRKILLACAVLFICTEISLAQLSNVANFNRSNITPDPTMPYYKPTAAGNIGIRSVWVANDLDNDGKQELIITDYSNNGRVHVLELNGDALEIVWSSPIVTAHSSGSGSTPRWVRSGDLDGDGKGEIIFPLTQGTADYQIQLWEWDGINDNSYILATVLEVNAFAAQGVGNFRTNREVAEVFDFDGDGLDELIMTNRDHNVYVLGISGDVPGFGGWQLEGGDPAEVPVNSGKFSTSHWHSIPADINGDGNLEIVNHMWNFWGFWSIKPTGPNTYQYPDTNQANHYVEFLRPLSVDGVSYMGVQRVDVDGDGKDEIAGIIYSGVSDIEYALALVSLPQGGDPLYSWDQSNYVILAEKQWELAGKTGGSFWGIGAADLNNNGREEILIGGSNDYNIVAIEYNGSGDILDPANYTSEIIFSNGHYNRFSSVEIIDSAGVIDTVAAADNESPFISKMFAGSDINGNNKQEVIVTYQSVVDSIKYTYKRWDGSAFVTDSVAVRWNPNQITVWMLESLVTGIRTVELPIISPDDYRLAQNYPNPFNPTTNIQFTLPIDKKISLHIYDILGNEIKTLIDNEELARGVYEVTWDGTNNSGSAVASGQYIYTLKYGNFSKSMKMTLLK